jgi:hypothetical protein
MNSEIVEFYGTNLVVVTAENGDPWASVKHICDGVGVDFNGQRKKLLENPVYNSVVEIMSTTGSDGKTYEMLCISTTMIAYWLSSIHPNKVSEEIRPTLIVYQQECARVLGAYFSNKIIQCRSTPAIQTVADLVNSKEFFERFVSAMGEHFTTKTEHESLRYEVEDLRDMLQILWDDKDMTSVQKAINELKAVSGWDGRKVLGLIRSELNTQRVYVHELKDKVINICKKTVGLVRGPK